MTSLRACALFLAGLLAPLFAVSARAQGPVSVAMFADIHFDPFRDPARVAELNRSPLAQWPAILGRPGSPTAVGDLQKLLDSCHTHTLDTAWPLFERTLAAARAAEPHPRFVTLSGDLLTHEFPCRLQHALPGATPGDVPAFAAKTVGFVLAQLRATFPGVPVYATLGNNDSGCADYHETPDDRFLQAAASALAEAAHIPPAAISAEGSYTVALPAPMQRTRLVVINDIFDSRLYATCGGDSTSAAEKAQLATLQQQLQQARSAGEHVWVLAHIPPGVDVYTSFRRFLFHPEELCSATPETFLADDALPELLLQYADIITLGLFGHTHMDELRVLAPEGGGAPRAGAAIPLKIVPSVSPFIGNHAAFFIGRVDPRSAVLKDWATWVTPDPAGSAPPWVEAYHFSTAYGLPAFSGEAATQLTTGFAADHAGTAPASSTFRQHFFPGDIGLYAMGLDQLWPAYSCTVRHFRATDVKRCLCSPAATPRQP